MKLFLTTLISIFLLFSCGDNATNDTNGSSSSTKTEATPPNDGKGIGETTSVTLNNPLVPSMVESGKAIYEMKCAACHKLTSQRVVGPGWAGVTTKRKPEWIMNMTTNIEVMLEEDPEARELLKECLVRMPNQNLSVDDARNVLEFMFENDAQKAGAE